MCESERNGNYYYYYYYYYYSYYYYYYYYCRRRRLLLQLQLPFSSSSRTAGELIAAAELATPIFVMQDWCE